MKTIIVLSDILKYKHIASAFKGETNLDGHILEAQLTDLKPWLGDAFLLELIEQRATNTLTDANKLALYGGQYTYDNKTYYCEGIAAYMAFSVHARYTLRSSVALTQFGAVVKESDYSTPASGKQIAEIKGMSESTAEAIKQDVVIMFQRKKENYPLYNSCSNKFSGRRTQFRIIGD